MAKNHSDPNPRYVPAQKNIPSEQEAEARLHQEGYDTFRWHDVPGTTYPRHQHTYDECIWVLKGEITFKIGESEFKLQSGDRLYLPAKTPHTASVPTDAGVTYLVGEFRSSSSG
jgi:quercetin dioxygenase-like cupin family protein